MLNSMINVRRLCGNHRLPYVKDVNVAANTSLDIAVVKSTLNSFCAEEGNYLDWNGLFIGFHRITIEAYVFANCHVVGLCKAGLYYLISQSDGLKTAFLSWLLFFGFVVRMFRRTYIGRKLSGNWNNQFYHV